MRNNLPTKAGLAFCAGLLHLFSSSLSYCGAAPSLDQLLLQVRNHVKEYEASLPDFICNEKITSRERVRGGIGDQILTESVFRGTQNKDATGSPFTESREIKSVNGRPAAKGEQLRVPFFFGGAFSSVLDATFGEKNIQYHKYKLIGTQQVAGKAALAIQFATRAGQKDLFFEFLGSKFISRDTGTAWIDAESMHVIRLERTYLNLPLPYGVMTVSINYAPVVLNGKTFWMPKTVQVEETLITTKPMAAEYIAEYSEYQKFDVSVRIQY